MDPEVGSKSIAGPRVKRKGILVGVLAVAIGMAILLAILFGNLLGGQPTPTVELDSPSRFGGILYISVASAEPRAPLADFRAVLEVENVTFSELAPLAHNATAGSLGFRDEDRDGRLSQGDQFTIIARDAGYHEFLILHGQTRVANTPWLEVPTVGLGSLTIGPSEVTVDVLFVVPGVATSAFRAVLSLDGVVIGDLNPLADGAVNGNLTFSEQVPDARLNEGDRFTSTSMATGDYELAVLWRGVVAGQGTWSI